MFGRKRRRRLERENAALREALGWYADGSNWRRSATNGKGEPRRWLKSPAAFDRGARAKFVLSQLPEPFSRVAWRVSVRPEDIPELTHGSPAGGRPRHDDTE